MFFATDNARMGPLRDEWCDEWQVVLDRRRTRRADSAAMTPSLDRVPLRVIFGVATALSFFSAFAGVLLRVDVHREARALRGCLLALNLGYWYSWAALTPGILWLSRRFPFDRAAVAARHPGAHRRRRRRHDAARRAGRGAADGHLLAHRRVARLVAARSAADVLPELRLGDDDLLDHRRARVTRCATSARRAREN